jgi:colanic acid/amylovoran biosynthesis glycosyltransferase
VAHKIAYLMSRFPHLPETFILREMIELERQGWQIALYPLIRQEIAVIHPEVELWLPRIRPLPFMAPEVLGTNIQALLRNPFRYLGLWAKTLWENRHSSDFFIRALALFPKAVYAAKRMQQEKITHIHAHYATYPALVAWLIHQLTGISYSITVHAHDIFVDRTMLAPKLAAAAFIVAISEYNRDYLAQHIGEWVRLKTHVVHCGIEPEKYVPRLNGTGWQERFELVSIGSLQPYKGQSYLIEACALLKARGIPVHCCIIGGGEEQARLEKLIAQLNLQTTVELAGPQPQEEVARLLSTAHCYVQPSIITPSGKMEGIPVALMEALATSLPVVATAISGIPELIYPGKTGYLVPPADATALAAALAEVYTAPAEAIRLGKAGRELVLKEFELKMNVSLLAQLLAELPQNKFLPEIRDANCFQTN